MRNAERGILSAAARPALRAPRSAIPSLLYLRADAEPLAICAAAADAPAGAPRLPTFSGVAYTGGLLVGVGCYSTPVVVDLEGLIVPAKSRPILFRHDDQAIVGHSTSIDVAKQIKIAGIVSGTGDAAGEIVANAANGFPWQLSIGVRPTKMAYVDDGEKIAVNGRNFKGPLYVCHEGTLSEISFVALGADDNTSARVAASLHLQPESAAMPPFADWITTTLGFAAETDLSESQRTALQATYDRLAADPADDDAEEGPGARGQGPGKKKKKAVTLRTSRSALRASADPDDADEDDTELEDPIGVLRARAADELDRQAAIGKLCGAGQAELQAKAIREGWDAQRAELEILRAGRPSGPAIHSRSHEGDCTLDALCGAMMLRAGIKFERLTPKLLATREAVAMFASSPGRTAPAWLRGSLDDDKRAKAMEFAHRYSSLSDVDLCRECCRLDGHYAIDRTETIQAAFSGGSLGNMFNTNVNAGILAGYLLAGDSTRGWTQENTDVPNFQPRDLVRMSRGGGLKKLPRGKQAQHTSFGDNVEQYRIARYAQQFQIDEQDAIDERFGSIMSEAIRMMSEESAALRPDLVYAILLANANLADGAALFVAGHNNLKTTAAMTAANLKIAIAALELQTENGRNLSLQATHLIGPSSLKHTEAELLQSTAIVIAMAGSTDANRERGTLNTIMAIEQILPVADARLENGVTDPDSGIVYGGSSTTWFLASNQGHTIEVGYLRGTGAAPQVRTWSLDKQGEYGLGADVKLDIGAKAKDFRAMVKNTA